MDARHAVIIAALLAAPAGAVPIDADDLAPITEDFEGLLGTALPVNINGRFGAVPVGFTFPSGAVVELPDAEPRELLWIGDYAVRSSTFRLFDNGRVEDAGDLRSGTAYACVNVENAVAQIRFPTPVGAFGLFVSATTEWGDPVIVRALASDGSVIETLTRASTPVPLDGDNFFGLGSLPGAVAVQIEGDFVVFDDLVWVPFEAVAIDGTDIVATAAEGFEDVAAGLPSSTFGSAYRVPPAGFAFSSGLTFVTPNPNDSDGLVIGDFDLGLPSFGLGGNGSIDDPSDLADGTAYAAHGSSGGTLGFRFPEPVTAFTVDVVTSGAPFTLRVFDTRGEEIATTTFNQSGPLPIGRPFGFGDLDDAAGFEISCSTFFVIDNVRWRPPCAGDLNEDGVKNIFDIILFFDLFSRDC